MELLVVFSIAEVPVPAGRAPVIQVGTVKVCAETGATHT